MDRADDLDKSLVAPESQCSAEVIGQRIEPVQDIAQANLSGATSFQEAVKRPFQHLLVVDFHGARATPNERR